MGSAELGMRWTLGNGVGLYTGLYFDYGFLKVNDKKATTASIINAVDYNYNEDGRRIGEAQRAVDKVNTMAGGLILRLSFGKPAVIAPVCEPCPGPQTVIREKHITIHDTIYVEKEVPQEIKQKMKDLSNALFAFDKFNINTKAASILDDIAGWMKQNPDMKLELSGHTDGKGSVAYNQKLSEQRAKAVYDYLVKAGVSNANLTWKGYGKSEPIATNDTAEGRQLNRRVELRIVK
ncbi:MAG: OmpA family protein [Prevotella sp.]|nr:OmpA family protein [Prevotella sp.]